MDRPATPLQVLSLQSHVSYGHVGNAAAVFALQRLGVEAWPINTVHFSNHTGYDGWRGTRATAQEVADLVLGVSERGLLSRLDAVLSGYLGSAEIAEVVGASVTSAKSANPRASYCLDPVLGAAGRGLYAAPDTAAAIKHTLVPVADIVTRSRCVLHHGGTQLSAICIATGTPQVILSKFLDKEPDKEPDKELDKESVGRRPFCANDADPAAATTSFVLSILNTISVSATIRVRDVAHLPELPSSRTDDNCC